MSTPRRKNLSASTASPTNRERKKPVPKSPLDLLKEALGRKHAALLEFIPLDKIEYVEFQGQDSDYLLRHRIRVGTIQGKDGTSQVLWAYLNRHVRGDGSPELCFFGSHATHGDFCPWKSGVVASKAELREEFKFWFGKSNVLSTVLKACFILKGAELPLNLDFKDSFLATLVRSCRRYEGDSVADIGLTPISHNEPADVDRSCPASRIEPRPIMRKSEQRSCLHQTYDALTAKSTSSAPPDPYAAKGPASVFLMSRAHNPGSLPEGREATTEPLSAKEQLQMSMLKMTQSPTPDPRQSRKVATESPIAIPEATAPHFLHHEPRASCPDVTPQAPTGPASMKVLDAFLETNNEIQEIEDEITRIRSEVSIVDGAFMKQRIALAHHIDIEVTQRQSKDREEQRRLYDGFVIKQKKEMGDLKQKYADLKSEQLLATEELRQQQQTKMARLEELRRGLERKREGLSKEQLLDFFVAQQEKLKKRKREDSQD